MAKKLSDTDKIVTYLSKGGKLTTLKAIRLLNVFNLTTRCSDARRFCKVPIQQKRVKRNGKHFNEYYLPK